MRQNLFQEQMQILAPSHKSQEFIAINLKINSQNNIKFIQNSQWITSFVLLEISLEERFALESWSKVIQMICKNCKTRNWRKSC